MSAKPDPVLNVIGVLNGPHPRIDYFVISASGPTRFAVYAESAALPANHRLAIARNSAFSDLNYALYLGKNEQSEPSSRDESHRPPDRRAASRDHHPVRDDCTRLRGHPEGAAQQHLLRGIVVDHPAHRRRDQPECFAPDPSAPPQPPGRRGQSGASRGARRLNSTFAARENRRLYAEQRSVAETLQRALLPIDLPELAGIQCAVRYIPGVAGIEIGGDWYDLIDLDDSHLLLVVGDVSGRGLGAATVMASLRFAVHAYAVEGYSPARDSRHAQSDNQRRARSACSPRSSVRPSMSRVTRSRWRAPDI